MRCRGSIHAPAMACSTVLGSHMKIVVCMKQVVDLAQLRFRSDGRTPVLDNAPLLLGSFDKNALEAAVRIREAGAPTQVIALSVGAGRVRESIKEALAMGADEAVVVDDAALAGSDVATSARVLAAAIRRIGSVDLILMGEGSDDEYTGQVPARVAALLNMPQITYARELQVEPGGVVRATRDLEDVLEVVECAAPVVVSVTGELNTPRIPPLTAIMRAGKKPLQAWTLADLRDALVPIQVEQRSNLAPIQTRKNVRFEGSLQEQVAALLAALEQDGLLP